MKSLTIENICALQGKNSFAVVDREFAGVIQRLGNLSDAEGEVFLAAACVSQVIRQGHSCLALEQFAGTRYPLRSSEDPDDLPQITMPDLAHWLECLQKYPHLVAVVDGKEEKLPRTPLILDAGGRLYLQRYYYYEQQIIKELKQRCTAQPVIPLLHTDEIKNLHAYFKQYKDADPDWQQIALFIAATQNFTIITGGPGTGKTTVVSAFLALELKKNPHLQIALAAPTGKAAMRLKEAIQQEVCNFSDDVPLAIRQKMLDLPSSTLHGLLGYRYGDVKFKHDCENPLPCDILVVDECSMISLTLMSKLFAAVPADCKLLLLGDRNQLPSIEAGSVLADICQCGTPNQCFPEQQTVLKHLYQNWQIPLVSGNGSLLSGHIMELQKTYRFNEEIRQVALLIEDRTQPASERSRKIFDLSGKSFTARTVAKNSLNRALKEKISSVSVEISNNDGSKKLYHFTDLKKLADEGGPENLAKAFDLIQSFKILCAVRGGPTGVSKVNQIVQDILDMKKDKMPGTPIMITRNDYETNLANGEIGLIWKKHGSTDPDELCVYFQEHPNREFSLSELPSYETVFAMTVHKSQGSGFKNVLLILPDQDHTVLTTELLYTAVTRAKNQVELWGSPKVLTQALQRQTLRYSGLADALK